MQSSKNQVCVPPRRFCALDPAHQNVHPNEAAICVWENSKYWKRAPKGPPKTKTFKTPVGRTLIKHTSQHAAQSEVRGSVLSA